MFTRLSLDRRERDDDCLPGNEEVQACLEFSSQPDQKTSKLHIVHVTESVRGGTSTYVELLIKESLRRGHRVTLVCDERLLTPELRKIDVARRDYRSARSGFGILSASRCVRSLLTTLSPDVVHLHGTFPGLYVRALRSPSYKIVYCAHGWSFRQDVPWLRKALYAGVERLLSPNADAIINISNDEGRAARQWKLGGRHVVIRNGVGLSRATGRRVIEPKRNVLNLGFIGRFDRQKGLDILLNAVSSCRNRRIHLWVVGAHSRDQSASQRAPDNVSFLGWFDSNRIDDFICDVDAVVIPSRWEGFGLVGLEAMRNGRPLIASDRGGLPEMVIHGFNGLLFNLDDPLALTNVLEKCEIPELRRMGVNALAVYRDTFGVDRMLDDVDHLYRCLVPSI